MALPLRKPESIVARMPPPRAGARPHPTLRMVDALGIVVGTVIGAGIFKTPALVAANAGSEAMVLLAWGAGGAISLVGALCYAELATTYPHAGGDYHYLGRAFGGRLAFLFAWARLTVIQTGAIVLLAFVLGDYASRIVSVGPYSSSLYAAFAVAALTGLNVLGVRFGKTAQNVLTAAEVVGLLLIVAAAFLLSGSGPPATAAPASPAGLGLVMVFVLLTYGGWNEAAYVSAEVRDPRRNIVRALVWGLLLVTALYVLVSWALLRVLGLGGLAASSTAAADVMQQSMGHAGAQFVSLLIVVAAITSANATIFTGARSAWAFGRDVPLFAPLGRGHRRAHTPVNALLAQGAVALALVLFGALTRNGFETIVEYTAPVFWLFFLLTGVSLLVLRAREPHAVRPFRVPGYPLTPLLFCATSAYLLYSSLAYTGVGALVGLAVVGAGALVLPFARAPLRQPFTNDADGGR
ncbi:MAG TPA: amino acid permease [Candidatus Limnocylindria bacterium]|nr:amino acid permease [Candidatus Limnocylindria bacterium]